MSLTPEDIAAILTKSAGYDSTHTPRISVILTSAWLEHFNRYIPTATREDLLEAVTEYHHLPHDRMIQPGDLSLVYRAKLRDNTDRTDPELRALPGDSKGGELPDYPVEWTSEERLAAYWYLVKSRCTRPAKTENWHTILRIARRPSGHQEAS